MESLEVKRSLIISKVLITGNLGYVGSVLTKYLRSNLLDVNLIGFDLGLFANCLITKTISPAPEVYLDTQVFKDIRYIDENDIKGIDKIIHLAAISNDPIGNQYEKLTYEINRDASIKLFKLAVKQKVTHFIFASTCSVYGANDRQNISENDSILPLTAYAKSKAEFESFALSYDAKDTTFTSLRFATACGASSRIRLDLAVNDFVVSAYLTKKIVLNSQGNSWRPFIDIEDMCKAIHWSLMRNQDNGSSKIIINVGSNNQNYIIKNLAEKISSHIGNTKVYIKENALSDKRSYKVNFDLFSKIANPTFLPTNDISSTTKNIINQLNQISYNDIHFRDSNLIRLNVIKKLINNKILSNNLEWNIKE